MRMRLGLGGAARAVGDVELLERGTAQPAAAAASAARKSRRRTRMRGKHRSATKARLDRRTSTPTSKRQEGLMRRMVGGLALAGLFGVGCGHAQVTGSAKNDWSTPSGHAQATDP